MIMTRTSDARARRSVGPGQLVQPQVQAIGKIDLPPTARARRGSRPCRRSPCRRGIWSPPCGRWSPRATRMAVRSAAAPSATRPFGRAPGSRPWGRCPAACFGQQPSSATAPDAGAGTGRAHTWRGCAPGSTWPCARTPHPRAAEIEGLLVVVGEEELLVEGWEVAERISSISWRRRREKWRDAFVSRS